jgi:hypothetical protein
VTFTRRSQRAGQARGLMADRDALVDFPPGVGALIRSRCKSIGSEHTAEFVHPTGRNLSEESIARALRVGRGCSIALRRELVLVDQPTEQVTAA